MYCERCSVRVRSLRCVRIQSVLPTRRDIRSGSQNDWQNEPDRLNGSERRMPRLESSGNFGNVEVGRAADTADKALKPLALELTRFGGYLNECLEEVFMTSRGKRPWRHMVWPVKGEVQSPPSVRVRSLRSVRILTLLPAVPCTLLGSRAPVERQRVGETELNGANGLERTGTE